MATIREVSKLAGVSVATVSRTITTPDKVSVKTQKKVQEAIEKTNYKPNILARNFRTRKSSTVVVLVPDIANPFFSRVIRGIEQTAQKLGYAVLLGDTQRLREREQTYANMVKTSQADGLIQLDCHIPFDQGEEAIFPTVNVCDCVKNSVIPTIELDNELAAYQMTQHLIELGHQNIAVVAGPQTSTITQDRFTGFKKAVEETGISLSPKFVYSGDYSIQSGKNAAEHLLSLETPPTAIFCFNDEMAIGAIRHIKDIGLAIPKDVAIAGFDDISFAEYCDPPLTTIAQPAEEFGTEAMSMLFGMMNDEPPENKRTCLPFELVIRESTAGKK